MIRMLRSVICFIFSSWPFESAAKTNRMGEKNATNTMNAQKESTKLFNTLSAMQHLL